MNLLRRLSVAVVAVASGSLAPAGLISIGNAVFVADSITLGTETGLEWLEVTQSQGP
jgi:hypothetical protein